MSEDEAEYNVGDTAEHLRRTEELTRAHWEELATYGRRIPARTYFEALAEKSGRTWQQELIDFVMAPSDAP